MKITSASGYVKNIPKKYEAGVDYVTESQLEAPHKKRLTKYERFLFATATERAKMGKYYRDFLRGCKPVRALKQINRYLAVRYVVVYETPNGGYIDTIVSKHTYSMCPKDKRKKSYVNWL